MLSVPAGLFLWFPPIPLPTPLLPTGACRFVLRSEDYAGLFPFCQNSGRSGIGIFCDLACSKHPADVPFKKSSGHVRHIKCPPPPFKQLDKTGNAVISLREDKPEPLGKHGMPVREKRWETVEMPTAKFTLWFFLKTENVHLKWEAKGIIKEILYSQTN